MCKFKEALVLAGVTCRKSPDFSNSVLTVAYCSYRALSALDRLITIIIIVLPHHYARHV